jgi:hypothetical protein
MSLDTTQSFEPYNGLFHTRYTEVSHYWYMDHVAMCSIQNPFLIKATYGATIPRNSFEAYT